MATAATAIAANEDRGAAAVRAVAAVRAALAVVAMAAAARVAWLAAVVARAGVEERRARTDPDLEYGPRTCRRGHPHRCKEASRSQQHPHAHHSMTALRMDEQQQAQVEAKD